MFDLTDSHLIKIFKSGVSNTFTVVAQKKAIPVNIEPICNLFLNWKDNEILSEDLLRKKSLALCSFVGMLRPSDASLLVKCNIFFLTSLEYMDICLLGFKTGGQANGEVFRVWHSSVKSYVLFKLFIGILDASGSQIMNVSILLLLNVFQHC